MSVILKEIEKTEWFPDFVKELENKSPDFIKKMKNRMLLSYYKYGPVKDSYGPKGNIDPLDSGLERLELYLKTKNTEYLIDTANFLGIEFKYPSYENEITTDKSYVNCENNVEYIRKYINLYRQNGYRVYLKNAAYYCIEETLDPYVKDIFFEATGSDKSPGRITKGGEREYVGENIRNLLTPRKGS